LESGYWTVRIEATNDDNETLPLYTEVFSTKAKDYPGWHETFANAVERVRNKIGSDAIWIFDRAFDGLEWMRHSQELGLSWLIRQQQTRNIKVATGAIYDMRVFASCLNRPHQLLVPYVDKSTHERMHFEVQFGYAPVRVPRLDADLYLIVVQRPMRDVLALLTNIQIRSRKQAARLVLAYMRRWGVEDGIRFWKQKTGIEDFRVRNWNSIRRLVMLSMIAAGLQALMLLTRPSLAQRFIQRVKVFIENVPFRQYRLWDGLRDALIYDA
jgi:transposase